ncbi:hypothetical protein FN846DRAFT_914621 [Sphaerosporella brunnea]|uniref:SGNH hydrolase-type esterase domain-containing protein n=1 Tax=Sphaerosporella brunnea TaxID=1250544 RepID=A0A5J5ED32_9PEZI|nr:hypothetical protein FN846DRAFT_914621 [Sphaerosporella brunnea]
MAKKDEVVEKAGLVCLNVRLLRIVPQIKLGCVFDVYLAIGLLPNRIVIFGDESSAIPSADTRRRGNGPSPNWAASLCQNLYASCDSFAPLASAQGFVGSVIDNVVSNTSSPDLRDQVDRWIEFEMKARNNGFGPERSSLFALLFGTNDMWKFSYMDRKDASSAVEASLDSMFDHIGRVARHWANPPQVLVPTAIDVYALSGKVCALGGHALMLKLAGRWTKYRLQNDTAGEALKTSVFTRRKWNEGLEKKGKILEGRKSDALGCWPVVYGNPEKRGERWLARCQRHMFEGKWDTVDSMHLGAREHEIMAEEAVKYLL